MAFGIKPIKPKKMKIDQIRTEIRKDITAFRRRVIFDDFRGTVKTWKHDTPNFKSEVVERNDFIIKAFLVRDGSLGSNKWFWLNNGTKTRWALMSGDWQSKTKPGTLKAGGGRGRVIVVGKRHLRRPRTGIEDRHWTELIFETRNPEFVAIVNEANRRGVNKIYD